MSNTTASITLSAHDRTQAAFRSAMAGLEKLKKSAFSLKTALAGVLAGAGIAAGIKSILDYSDKTAKLADTLKISTKELQQYRFAGEQSRLTNEELDKGLTRLSKSLGELRIGQGALNQFLKTADPDFLKTLKNSKDFSESLDLILKRIGALKNPTEQAALANAAFGRSYQGFIRLTAEGGKVLADLKQQALDYGIVLDDKFLRKSEAVGDKLNVVMKILRVAWAHVVDGMIPALEKLADYFAKNSEQVRDFGRAIGDAIVLIVEGVAAVKKLADKIAEGYQNMQQWLQLNVGDNWNLDRFRATQFDIDRLSEGLNKLKKDYENIERKTTAWGSAAYYVNKQTGEIIKPNVVDAINSKIIVTEKYIEKLNGELALKRQLALIDSQNKKDQEIKEGPKFKDSLNRKDDDKQKNDALKKKINDLELQYLSEEEKQYVHLSKMQSMLDEALQKNLITRERYNQIREDMEERTAEKVAEINMKAAEKQYKHGLQAEKAYRNMKLQTVNMAAQLLQTLGQKSKAAAIAAIVLNKAVAIAQTIQNTAAAVMKSYTLDPTGVLAAKIAFVGKLQLGIIAATGLAEISNAGKDKGGGGSIGSPGQSVAQSSDSGQRPSSAGRRVEINLGDDRDLISKSAVRKLIDRINEEIKDGASIFSSR